MIGIIAAMKEELEGLRACMQDRKDREISGICYSIGTIAGQECVVAVSGIGKVFAAVCAQTMILTWKPALLLNVGIAGGLAPELSVCDIAIATNVIQHDMDTSPFGDPVGFLSGINLVELPADSAISEKLADTAESLSLHTLRGNIVSGDQFVNDTDKKRALRKQFAAIACEMEGAAIGHVAYLNHVPFAVLRAISDSVDTDVQQMDYESFKHAAVRNTVKILQHFLEATAGSL